MKAKVKRLDDLQIEHVLLSELWHAENNSRTHSAKQIQEIVASMEEFGYTSPILIDEERCIIAGHGRKAALLSIGETSAPCIVLTGLTETQRRAYLIADNQLPLNAGWDTDILRQEIKGLKALDFDTDVLGFDASFLDNLFSDALPPGLDPDRVPDLGDGEQITNVGDVWLLGAHRVMCGDSTRADDVARLFNGGEKAHMLHADPPYGMGKQKDGVENDNLYREQLDAFQMAWWRIYRDFIDDNAGVYIWGNASNLWRLWYLGGLGDSEVLCLRNEIVWDKSSAPGMATEIRNMYTTGSERCLYFQIGEQFVGNLNADQYWSGWDQIRLYLSEQAEACGLTPAICRGLTGKQMYSHWFSKSQWTLIPEKHYQALQVACPGYFLTPYGDIREQYEEIKGGYRTHINGIQGGMRSYFDNAHDAMYDVWSFPRVVGEERHQHATPKPVDMMARIMRSSLPREGLCVEPFGGSGSTLIGAERTGRRCYTMEMTPAYVDVIVRRWQDLTGGVANREDGGASFDS